MSRRRSIDPYSRGAALAIIALGFALRAWVVFDASTGPISGDEATYWSRAGAVLATGDPGTAFQPPGMAYAVALARWIAPNDLTTARALNLAWYVLGAVALIALAGTWRRALVPLCVFAFHPVLVGFSGFLWNESFFIGVLLAAFALAARGAGWRAAAAGATFGLAALVRQVGLTFFALALARRLWEARSSGLRLRDCAMMALAFAVVVAPWPARNWIVLGVPVYTTSAGFSLWVSNEREVGPPYAWQYRRLGLYTGPYEALGTDELSRDAEAYRRGRAFIASEMPGWIVKKTTVGLAHLYEPDNFVLRRARVGYYGQAALPWLPVLGVITLGGEAIVLVWGAYVMLSLRDHAATLMVLAMTVANAAIQVLTVAHSRHRLVLGLLPLVVTGVARKPFSAGRLAVAVAIVAALATFGIRSPGWDQLAHTFSGDRTVEPRPLTLDP